MDKVISNVIKCVNENFIYRLMNFESQIEFCDVFNFFNINRNLSNALENEINEIVKIYLNNSKDNDENVITIPANLEKIIIMKSENLLINFCNLVVKANEDKKEIIKKYKLKDFYIEDVELVSNDSHNKGKMIFKVVLKSRDVIYYKPKSLKSDIFFDDVLKFFYDNGVLKYEPKYLQSIDRGSYGWQIEKKYRESESEDDIIACIYFFGVYNALFYLFNSSDMHCENIIINSDFPYLIDTETLMTNYSFLKTKSLFDNYISNSVGNTGFINIRESEKFTGMLYGYGNNEKVYKNVIKYKSKKIDIAKYLDYLLDGFFDVIYFVLENKEIIKNYLYENKLLNEIDFRICFRNTSYYYKILSLSKTPNFIENNNKRKRCYDILYGNKKKDIKFKWIIKEEIRQMFEFEDIPYFTFRSNNKNLSSSFEKNCRNFFDMTMMNCLLEKIDNLNENRIDFQKNIILSKFNSYEYFKDVIRDEIYEGDSLENYIYSNNCLYDKERIILYNINDSLNDNNLTEITATLYDGVGVVIYLMYTYSKTKSVRTLQLIENYVEYFDSFFDEYSKELRLGLFDGVTSLLALYIYYIDIIGSNEKVEIKCRKILKFLLSINIECIKQYDIISGVSGIIIFLLNRYKYEKKNIYYDVVLHLSEFFDEFDISLIDKTGFAHGFAGVSAALFSLFSITKKKSYYDKGVQLVDLENKYYSKEKLEWKDIRRENFYTTAWCYGGAGIMASRMIIYDSLPKSNYRNLIYSDILKCKESIMRNGIKSNYGNILCHGKIGNLNMLYNYAKKFNDFDILNYTVNKTEEIYKETMKLSKINSLPNVSFMVGLSGYAYHLMYIKNNDIRAILMLE